MLELIVQPLATLASKVMDAFVDSDEIKKANIKAKVLKVEAKANAELRLIEQKGTWEQIQAESGKSSLKDEWFTILFSIPLILVFIPPMQEYVLSGFTILETLPEWYTSLIEVMVYAVFGIRVPVAVGKYRANKELTKVMSEKLINKKD